MRLVVGLGNPGDQYRESFHNVGFSVLDLLSTRLSLGAWSRRFKGLVVRGGYQRSPFVLLKPQTYMNASGQSVVSCGQFYKIQLEDTLVISDDIDLPLGTARYRLSGGHGGHNGLRSIIDLCGANSFHRIRIGVGRPYSRESVANYLLRRPPAESQKVIESTVEESVNHVLDFIVGHPVCIPSKK